MKDELTGNDYFSEKNMYIRYHGLTEDEADLVMQARTHLQRDEIFTQILASKHRA